LKKCQHSSVLRRACSRAKGYRGKDDATSQESTSEVGFSRSWDKPTSEVVELVDESAEGGAEVGCGVVLERFDERMAVKHVLHDAALDASAAAVNQAHLAEAGTVRRADVLVDD
jgi:hypothetical protein